MGSIGTLLTVPSALSLVLKKSQVSSGGNFYDCLGILWVMERKGLSDRMVEVANGEVLIFGVVHI